MTSVYVPGDVVYFFILFRGHFKNHLELCELFSIASRYTCLVHELDYMVIILMMELMIHRYIITDQ